ncbi:MAG: cell division protein SepF [Acidimicrobiales bacterium]
MAGLVHKAMVYLGLTDDDYDDYDGYDDQAAVVAQPPRRVMPEAMEPQGSSLGGVRTLPPRDVRDDSGAGVTLTPRPSSVVRPITPIQGAKVHVLAPTKFADCQEIGDRFKGNQPVIVNLQAGDRELSRRMIDFCAGVAYALGGSMDKVADQVFLLTPTNVEVSAEEKRRLQERGLFRS